MSRRVALVAAAADAELIVEEGDFEWGEVRAVSPGTTPECDVVIEMAGARAGACECVRVLWLDRAPGAEPPLVVAPAGEALWRRRPLPVARACFDLPEPSRPRGVVVGPDSPQRSELVEGASSVGVEVDVAERLSLAVLEQASSVAFTESTDRALSAWAFCVLAAGRLLFAPSHQVGFGLRHGIDHLQFNDPDELASLLRGAQVDPSLFNPVREGGRRAAERHRTATVLGKLVGDLEIEGRFSRGARAREEIE